MKFIPPPTSSSQFSQEEYLARSISQLQIWRATYEEENWSGVSFCGPSTKIHFQNFCLYLWTKQFCKHDQISSLHQSPEGWLRTARYDLFSCNNFPQCVFAAKKLSEYVNPGFSYNFLHKYQDGKFDAWLVLYTIFITNLTVMVLFFFFFDQYSFFCSCCFVYGLISYNLHVNYL